MMELKVKDNEVLEVRTIDTGNQIVRLEGHYCWLLKTILTVENSIIRCDIYTYLNEFQSDFNGTIIFECQGEMFEVQAINGIAEIRVDIATDEAVTIRTVNPNMDNSEVTING